MMQDEIQAVARALAGPRADDMTSAGYPVWKIYQLGAQAAIAALDAARGKAEPVAWMYTIGSVIHTFPDRRVERINGIPLCDYAETPLYAHPPADRVARVLTDPQRMLWKDDVEGICPNSDLCFECGDRVRCWPCAAKQSASLGVAVDTSQPALPEVSRLRRELKAQGDRVAQVVEWLRKENGICDCHARCETECGCGAWDDWKTKPLLQIADAIERGEPFNG